MNTQKTTPRHSQLQESTAGEEDPGAGLDAADSAIHPDGVAPSAEPGHKTPEPAMKQPRTGTHGKSADNGE